MLDALPHRGPNDRGIHVFNDMVFGHTRLSIVDVAGGHQPILANNGRGGVIHNGEIYNFRKLREGLALRHHFTTDSDSEVIVHLFREKGTDCVHDLDGMFAFAVNDDDRFMLARDPLGIKPLYYGYVDGNLYFASELGAMSLAGVEEVHEFPAGHYYAGGEGFVRYYDIPEAGDRLMTDVEAASKLLRENFIRAVKKRLLADKEIPVGSFCSGGIDSSLIAAIAAEEIPRLHTFVVGVRDENGIESDDLAASRIAAAHIGSTHHELLFSEDEYCEAVHRLPAQHKPAAGRPHGNALQP